MQEAPEPRLLQPDAPLPAPGGAAGPEPPLAGPARGWPFPQLTRAALLDDDHGAGSLRDALGALLAHAEEACVAVSRIRIAALDLGAADLRRAGRCRVLVGRLEAEADLLPRDPEARAGVRANLSAVAAFLRSGRVEVRSASGQGWYPDYSLFRGLRMGDAAQRGTAVLLGAHWLAPQPQGPGLTALLLGRAAGERASAHFERAWGRAYDVLPVVAELLERLLEEAARGAEKGLDGG